MFVTNQCLQMFDPDSMALLEFGSRSSSRDIRGIQARHP
jgi:hypothetical protein